MDEQDGPTERGKVGSALAAGAVGIAGLVAILVWGSILAAAFGIDPTEPTTEAIVLSTVAGGLGTASVAAFYLAAGGLGLSYLDVSRPSLRGVGYVVGGTLLLFGLNVGVSWVLGQAGVDTATHSIVDQAEDNPEILLVLIPLAYLVIAPGEELLFRNVVQKSLYGPFSKRAAVVVASVIFAIAHVSSYFEPGAPLTTIGGLVTVFALSLVLGAIYARTENVLIPLLIHGSYDAVAFAVSYAQLT